VELTFFIGFWGKETILFSLEEKMKLALKILKNHFSGLGSEDAIEGLKSAEFTRDGGWNLSITFYTLLTRILIYPPVGIPVNGIIGSSVFNNNLFKLIMKKER
jgi:hypothetical protein